MNKLFWFLIVWLLLAIWTILYSDYNPQFKDLLCEQINFCNHSITNQSIELSHDMWNIEGIVHTVSEKIYPEVRFYKDNTWDQILMQEYLKKWTNNCKKASYWIAWSLDGCENITWYTHTYTINRLGIKLWTYSNSRPTSTDNPWIFRKDLIEPFLLSWNRIYEQEWTGLFTRYSYLEYHDFSVWETKDRILEQAKTKNYDGFLYDQERWITTITTGTNYMISYRRWEDYPLYIQYYFRDNKPYYYTADYGWDCMPWPCGLARHDIQLFTK